MDLTDVHWIVNKLNVASQVTRLHHIVADHLQVKSIGQPQLVHDLEELEDQVVLSQVVSEFPNELQLYSLLLVLIL